MLHPDKGSLSQVRFSAPSSIVDLRLLSLETPSLHDRRTVQLELNQGVLLAALPDLAQRECSSLLSSKGVRSNSTMVDHPTETTHYFAKMRRGYPEATRVATERVNRCDLLWAMNRYCGSSGLSASQLPALSSACVGRSRTHVPSPSVLDVDMHQLTL